MARIAGIGLWIGPVLFAFEGMGTALAIFESMGTADPAPFFRVITISYTVRSSRLNLRIINDRLINDICSKADVLGALRCLINYNQ